MKQLPVYTPDCAVHDDALIHLCQPGGGRSCAACCGIYNYADSSREALQRRLRQRTERFHREVLTVEDLPAFSQSIRAAEDQARRFDGIYCCEYAGFLDPAEGHVGCLLHPALNDGVDWREVSFYGRELCSGHICPSYQFLGQGEQRILVALLDDWYLYGLCLTDIDLVKDYLRHIGDLLGETPRPEGFQRASVQTIARRFFSYKVAWPFRSPEVNRFGRFSFDGSQYMIRPIDYEALGCGHSRYDGILLSLCSVFRNRCELLEAEAMIGENIAALAAAYRVPF